MAVVFATLGGSVLKGAAVFADGGMGRGFLPHALDVGVENIRSGTWAGNSSLFLLVKLVDLLSLYM